jgi:hypothetical protein
VKSFVALAFSCTDLPQINSKAAHRDHHHNRDQWWESTSTSPLPTPCPRCTQNGTPQLPGHVKSLSFDCFTIGAAHCIVAKKQGGVDTLQTNVSDVVGFAVHHVANEALHFALEDGTAAKEADNDDSHHHGLFVVLGLLFCVLCCCVASLFRKDRISGCV